MRAKWKTDADPMSGILPEGEHLCQITGIDEKTNANGTWWRLELTGVEGACRGLTGDDGLFFYGKALGRAAWALSMILGRELEDDEDVQPTDLWKKYIRGTFEHESREHKGKTYTDARVTYDGYAAAGNVPAGLEVPEKGKPLPPAAGQDAGEPAEDVPF